MKFHNCYQAKDWVDVVFKGTKYEQPYISTQALDTVYKRFLGGMLHLLVTTTLCK